MIISDTSRTSLTIICRIDSLRHLKMHLETIRQDCYSCCQIIKCKGLGIELKSVKFGCVTFTYNTNQIQIIMLVLFQVIIKKLLHTISIELCFHARNRDCGFEQILCNHIKALFLYLLLCKKQISDCHRVRNRHIK